jgi:hypothetical protein
MTMMFGPELLGQTEKTLSALLSNVLEGTGLTERQWVTLRIAESTEDGDLVAVVEDRARFVDAADLVGQLTDRALLADGRLTPAGRELMHQVLGHAAARTGPIWADLPAEDVAAATRVLTTVLSRARAALGTAA